MVYGRDTQREKVYDFERKVVWPLVKGSPVRSMGAVKTPMTLAQCGELVKAACDLYNLSAPAITDGRRRSRACWETSWVSPAGVAKFPVASRTPVSCLHEAAHRIAYSFDMEQGGHGPTFVRVFLDLLTYFFQDLSLQYLKREAAARHVKVAAPGVCPRWSSQDLKQVSTLKERKAALEKELAEVNARLKEIRARNRPTAKPPVARSGKAASP